MDRAMPRKRVNPTPRLIAGPYAAPRMRLKNGQLPCRLRGEVPVDGITEAPVPWPYTKHRGEGVKPSGWPMLIVCGDLERAIRTESVTAIAHHWGVAHSTVRIWRRQLGVERMTPGSRQLLIEHAHKFTKLTPKVGAIREGIAQGKTNQEIGRELGVKWQSVRRIRNGLTFAEEQPA
jgi:hypothetical protein